MKRTEDENRDLPNFNFNVAHDGDWVVLCAEPVLLCGVDVCGRQGPRDGTSVREWFELFKDHFSDEEWNWIRCDDNNKERKPKDQLSVFRLLWSCKEAFTKARGDGLACRLRRCTFSRPDSEKRKDLKSFYRLMLRFDNVERRDWDFVSMLFSDDHWITISRASPSEAIDAYGEFKRTFSRVDVGLCEKDDGVGLCDDDDDDLCDDKDQPPSIKFRILNANDLRSILQRK
jgi:4'-phosphopantetheinyl transferase